MRSTNSADQALPVSANQWEERKAQVLRDQREAKRLSLAKTLGLPVDHVPDDGPMLSAFSTSRTDTASYDTFLPWMSDAALLWAIEHERVKAGVVKLRHEARRRGLLKRGERRA